MTETIDPAHVAHLVQIARAQSVRPIHAASLLFTAAFVTLDAIPVVPLERGLQIRDVIAPALSELGLTLTRDVAPAGETIAARLATIAVCGTDHPADAIAGLIQAATAILSRRFAPEVVGELHTRDGPLATANFTTSSSWAIETAENGHFSRLEDA